MKGWNRRDSHASSRREGGTIVLYQRTHFVPNGEGWLLALKQTYDPEALERGWKPVAIVPGYGMNAFIFGYHPTGKSMEQYWAERGLEVWSLNLRDQGGSKRVGGKRRYGFYEAGVIDLGCAFQHILRNTETEADRLDAVGCSIGGTYLYVHLALGGKTCSLGSIVTMGSPLRWVRVHPAMKALWSSPRIAGMLSVRGVRPLARVVMPLASRVPRLLEVYLHPEIVEISKMKEISRTLENPNPQLNREISFWLRQKDLHVKGVNITEALADVDNPLLCVLSNADGVVPEPTVLSVMEAIGSSDKEVLRVGTEEIPVAHADMFVSRISQAWIFEPLARWLIDRNRPAESPPRGRSTPRRKRDQGRR